MGYFWPLVPDTAAVLGPQSPALPPNTILLILIGTVVFSRCRVGEVGLMLPWFAVVFLDLVHSVAYLGILLSATLIGPFFLFTQNPAVLKACGTLWEISAHFSGVFD